MKKLFILILYSLFMSCSQNLQDYTNISIDCECLEPLTRILVWDYPVKPGMEEWKEFQNNQEMVDACQIPEKILYSLSTEDLTEICLQYPLLYDVFAFGDLNKGFDKLFDDFNGIRELFKRKGVSKELLRRYNCKMQDLSFLEKTGSDIEKGLFIISVSALEILLLKKADAITNDNKNILQSLVFGYEKRNEYPDYFQGLGFQSNFYSRAYLIIKISPQSLDQFPQKGRNPVFFSGFVDKETMNKVNALSYQLI